MTPFSPRNLLLVTLVAATGSILSAQTVPPDAPPHFPDWWFEEGVIGLRDGEDGDVYADYLQPSDLSPITQGQLLHLADRAIAELDDELAAIDGAGFDYTSFLNGGTFDPANASVAITTGQLKFVSARFFDRFAEIGFTPASSEWPPSLVLNAGAGDNSPNYPWLNDQTRDNLSIAVIGQAKHLFSWDIGQWTSVDDNPADGIPDWHVTFAQTLDRDGDYDGDGATNRLELSNGTDPLNAQSVPVSYPDLSIMNYTYDVNGRVNAVTYGNIYRNNFDYDEEGSLRSSQDDFIEE